MAHVTNRFFQASSENTGSQVSSSTVFQDITDLGIDLSIYDQVTFRFMVLFKTDTTLETLKLKLIYPQDVNVIAYDHHILSAGSVNAPITGPVLPIADTAFVSWTQGYIENGPTPGDITMQFAAANGLGNITIMQDCAAVSWRVSP